ncbi:c-type cytochrome [Myxococcus landrumensis]|uniref:C-type cytochrome n=1 Tax=Myxococcus landrumensis TaxID=2813577 RepID=A0ABX7MYQ9_9BACT|nr:c-type cytochrome [Myxococcus landrumus]QSQ11595.1 c-type cytochrome [Myxococcus landrumus]
MKRLPFFALLLVPGLAAATHQGQSAFNNACASCHTLTPVRSVQSSGASEKSRASQTQTTTRSSDEKRVELGGLAHQRSSKQLREWIAKPSKVNKDTRCDTRLLPSTEMDALLDYLKTSARPPPLPRDEQLAEQNKADFDAYRAKLQREGLNTIRTDQGKK